MSLRTKSALSALFLAVLWIGLLSLLIPVAGDETSGRFAGDLLLDRHTDSFPYPFTIQNLMWLVFFLGCGELLARYIGGSKEAIQLHKGLMPEDDSVVLRKRDLGVLYKGLKSSAENPFLLQTLLARCILAFQIDGTKAQVVAVFNSTLDLYQNEIDLRYNLLKYLVWLIPTLGFIGTVVGIALALSSAGGTFAGDTSDLATLAPKLMKDLTQKLGVAFYTTLLALLQSALLMFALHFVQGREEHALNHIGQYCLDNLINRLYEE